MLDFYVQGDFKRPAGIPRRVASATRLIDFLEAAICRRTRSKPELTAVHPKVAFDVGVVISIDDGNRGARTPRSSQAIGTTKLRWAVAARRGRGVRASFLVRDHARVAPGIARRGRSRANRAVACGQGRG